LPEVRIIPRGVFNAIRFGGLSEEEIKETFPGLADRLSWLLPEEINSGTN
jgi:hypothetical protein